MDSDKEEEQNAIPVTPFITACLYNDIIQGVSSPVCDLVVISHTLWAALWTHGRNERIQQFGLAILMIVTVAHTLRMQIEIVPAGEVAPLVNMAVRRGIIPLSLRLFIDTKAQSRDALMAILVSVSQWSRPDEFQTFWNVVPSIVVHFLSVLGLANAVNNSHLGDLHSQFGEAIVGQSRCGCWKIVFLKLWSVCTVGSQLVLTALTTAFGPRGWTPLIAMVLMFPMFLAHLAEVWPVSNEPWYRLAFDCMCEPLFMLAPCFSSVFGLEQSDGMQNQGNRPGHYHIAMLTVRLFLLYEWATTGWIQQEWETRGGFTIKGNLQMSGDKFFDMYMLLYVLIGLPVSLAGFVVLLCNPYFVYGEQNVQPTEKMNAIVEYWEAQENGLHTTTSRIIERLHPLSRRPNIEPIQVRRPNIEPIQAHA